MFRRLQTKVAVLYAGLFGITLLVIALAVFSAVSVNVRRDVGADLQASGTVFDRIWQLRARQLQDNAEVVSRDFGFREAVATGDMATISSALQNLRARTGVASVMLVRPDGSAVSSQGVASPAAVRDIYAALQSDDRLVGVFVVSGAPTEVIAAPVLSPMLSGWLAFEVPLDGPEVASLEKLSPIPLTASVWRRLPGQAWISSALAAGRTPREVSAVSRDLAGISSHAKASSTLLLDGGRTLALVKPLPVMTAGAKADLLLRYPMAQAMAPYQGLTRSLVAAGLVALALLLLGSWLLARTVTRPISRLEDAAHRLQRGERAVVQVDSADEVGRLAASFNAMAAEIEARESRIRDDAGLLAAALHRAEVANRAMREFLSNMSHELRTPLNGVLGLSRVLSKVSTDARVHKLTRGIETSAEDLEKLVNDILDAAAIDAGQLGINAEPFSLSDTVRAAAAAWTGPAAEKGLDLQVAIGSEAEQTVLGDGPRLAQILDALLSNAVKFTERGGVVLDVKRETAEPQCFRFTVRDTGIGFDPAIKQQLFGRFQQADGSNTRSHGGAGLGLALSRSLAELMGGDLDCASSLGEGASFTVVIPLPAAAASGGEVQPALQRAG